MTARIVSLLPSATEILFALELGDSLVGVSHECDFPSEANALPRVSMARELGNDSASIHNSIAQSALTGLSPFEVRDEALAELRPELIVTQDTCAICAVNPAQLDRALASLIAPKPEVLSLSPSSLAEVFASIGRVASAAGVPERAEGVVRQMRRQLDHLRRVTAPLARRSVLFLEWLEPPMAAGHWSVELIRAAGGEALLAHDGKKTQARDWNELAGLSPDVIIVSPCGYSIEQTMEEVPEFLRRAEVRNTPAFRSGSVFAIDGHQFFNRAGPRLIRSAELAAACIHPGCVDTPSKAVCRKLR